MSRVSFKERRARMLARDISGLREVLADFDPFENWSLNRRPNSTTDLYFVDALFLLCAGHQGPETRAFLEWTIKIANRTLREKKCESKLCQGGFPANRAEVRRSRAFAMSLCGEALRVSALEKACDDLENYCQTIDGSNWDEVTQPKFLESVRLGLICGKLDNAKRIMASRRCTGKQKKEQDVLSELLSARASGLPICDSRLAERFDSVFNRARNPFAAEGIAALELGVLRDRYFTADNDAICWDRIIDAISK